MTQEMINVLEEQVELDEENIEKINEAIGNVSTALSAMKNGEDSGHSYDWIISNVDIYWNVNDNDNSVVNARSEMIGDLTKLRNDFTSGGNFEVDVDAVIQAAVDKGNSLQDRIDSNQEIIDAYYDSLNETEDTDDDSETSDDDGDEDDDE